MKAFVVFALFVWLLCGVAGAWMLDGPGNMHWKTIALGPISLVKGMNETPSNLPGPY
jgi:hypothetical protein